jgi:hypothetical protein
MALTLAVLNRMVWKRSYQLADTRFSLNRWTADTQTTDS